MVKLRFYRSSQRYSDDAECRIPRYCMISEFLGNAMYLRPEGMQITIGPKDMKKRANCLPTMPDRREISTC